MKCTGPLCVLSVVSLLVYGVAAVDFAEEIRRDFQMGIFPRQQGELLQSNLQAFSGALGGAAAGAITKSSDPKRPFEVDGDTFPDFPTAASRACDNQKNACAQMANSKSSQTTFAVSSCDKQNDECKAAAGSATVKAFAALTTSTSDFDIFCED